MAVLDPQYLDAIKGFEGYSPDAAWDYKQSSSGYGTKAQPGDETIPVDQRQAIFEKRFQDEVGKAANSVDTFAPNLPAGHRAALTSLTYNAGPSWQNSGLGEAVKAGDWDKARSLFLQYNHAGGDVNSGLTNRRQAEAAWFGGAPAAAAAQPAPAAPMQIAPQQQAAPKYSTPFFAGSGGPAAPAPQEQPMQPAAPMFAAQRRPVDLSKLRAAFTAPTFFAKG